MSDSAPWIVKVFAYASVIITGMTLILGFIASIWKQFHLSQKISVLAGDVSKMLSVVSTELKKNGGGSMKDRVDESWDDNKKQLGLIKQLAIKFDNTEQRLDSLETRVESLASHIATEFTGVKKEVVKVEHEILRVARHAMNNTLNARKLKEIEDAMNRGESPDGIVVNHTS